MRQLADYITANKTLLEVTFADDYTLLQVIARCVVHATLFMLTKPLREGGEVMMIFDYCIISPQTCTKTFTRNAPFWSQNVFKAFSDDL